MGGIKKEGTSITPLSARRPLNLREGVKKISPWPKPGGWSGEEVLERHIFKYEQGVESNYHRSAFLLRRLTVT